MRAYTTQLLVELVLRSKFLVYFSRFVQTKPFKYRIIMNNLFMVYPDRNSETERKHRV